MAVDPTRIAGDPQLRVAGMQLHTLFEEHSRMVYGLCRALLRDPHDAEDATQATFVSAYRSLLGGTEAREAAAWLATIARNECAGRARARMREPLPLLDAEVAHVQGPESELERKASVEDIQRAIADLPEKQREAVVLRDLYGLHYAEVGAALGMSVASVESLLFRARRRLRVSLKPLAGGVLTVPVALQEGVAQAIPTFTAAGAAGGGATTGAVGLGLLTKLVAGPAGVKVAAGVAAAVAAGSIAVAGVEHADRAHPHAVPVSQPAPTAGVTATPPAAAGVVLAATPVPAVRRDRSGPGDDHVGGRNAGGTVAAGADDRPSGERSGERRSGSGAISGDGDSKADGHGGGGTTPTRAATDRSGGESDRAAGDAPSGTSGGPVEDGSGLASGALASGHGSDGAFTAVADGTNGGNDRPADRATAGASGPSGDSGGSGSADSGSGPGDSGQGDTGGSDDGSTAGTMSPA